MNRLGILLVDDHVVVREGLKRVLETQPDLRVLGEAADGAEALAQVARLRPDLALVDLSMPMLTGIETTRRIKTASPRTRVLALTVHESEVYVREFLKAGAEGFLLKRATTEELLRAVRATAKGEKYIDPRLSHVWVRPIVERHPPIRSAELSDRELEVLRLIALGYANKEIAAKLELSVKSIETYKARAMAKLGLSDRVGIVQLARDRGWFTT